MPAMLARADVRIGHVRGRTVGPRGRGRAKLAAGLTLATTLLSLTARAQEPYLVKDINPALGGPANSYPTQLVAAGSRLFFVGCDPDHDCEPWTSDGTPLGTHLLKDIDLYASPSASGLAAVGNAIFFSGCDSASTALGYPTNCELWRSDGTAAGTVLVKDIYPGSTLSIANSSSPQNLVAVGQTLYFAATDGSHGVELWKSDGSQAGTVLVKDIAPGTSPSAPTGLTKVNGTLFFTTSAGLWRSDGTEAGTVLVKALGLLANLTNVNGTLFFVNLERELWKSDGTDAGTVMLVDFGLNNGPQFLTAVGATLYFQAAEASTGRELWKSDGSVAGTVLVKDILPGTGSSLAHPGAGMQGVLYFTAPDGAGGSGLWKSDGTAGGTTRVRTFGYLGNELVRAGGSLYFQANDGLSGVELWKSDGSADGTTLVRDINPGPSLSGPSLLVDLNGTLFFTALHPSYGVELWKSDGTAAGTDLVKDLNPGGSGSAPADLVDVAGTVFFQANDGTTGTELWKSDGTAAGTVLVKDIRAGASGSSPLLLFELDGSLYFRADDGITGQELWKSDGTPGGTAQLADINPSPPGSYPYPLAGLGGALIFSANDGSHGAELWRTDGTASGTAMVVDINPGPASGCGLFGGAVVLDGVLYFTADDGTHGRELWRTDGTAAGTTLVLDLNPGAASAIGSFSVVARLGGSLIFSGDDGTHGLELWRSDGTSAGTSLLKDITIGAGSTSFGVRPEVAGGFLYFGANDGSTGMELWRTDGTPAGTVLVGDILPGPSGSNPSNLTAVGELLLFTADDGVHGTELWRSDGTAGGTVLVSDIPSLGISGSQPTSLTRVLGSVFFAASEVATGREPWRSDGTEAGTLLLGDIRPDVWDSSPGWFTVSGDRVFFVADDGARGPELWAILTGADLAVSKTDGQAAAVPAQPLTYTITVANTGPLVLASARVTDSFPAALSCSTTCSGTGGATCAPGPYAGNIADTVSVPLGHTVRFLSACTLSPSATGTLANTVTVVPGPGVMDPNPANNTATDVDVIGVPPGAATATAQSSSSILVKWTDPNGSETGFRVERSTDGTSFTPVQTVGPNVTSHLDSSGLSPATLYYYRVVAVTPPGDVPSNVATATTFPASAAKACLQRVSPDHAWARAVSLGHNGTQWAAAWMDRRNGQSDEIYVQLLANASGAPVGSATRLTTNDMSSRFPTLRWNGTRFGLFWTEGLRDAAGNNKADYRFALLDASLNVLRGPVPLFTNTGTAATYFNDSAAQPLVWDGSGWGVLVLDGTNSPLDLVYYRLDEDGDRLVGPVNLTNTAGDWEFDVDAAWNGSVHGLVWVRQQNASTEVRFQRLQPNGTLLGSPTIVGPAVAGHTLLHANVVWDGAGWMAAWLDAENATGALAVYLRKLNADGTTAGPVKRLSSLSDPDFPPGTYPVHDDVPLLTVKPGGGYVVYTSSLLNTTNVYEVGRLEADANGDPVGIRTVLSGSDSHNSLYQRVASDGTSFLLAYHDQPGGTQELSTLKVSAAGAVLAGPNTLTSGHGAPDTQGFLETSNSPTVVSLAGGFGAVWSEPTPAGRQAYARFFDTAGNLAATRFPLTATVVGGRPALVGVGGTFAMAWRDGSNQVRLARFDATGLPSGGEVLVSAATGGPASAALDWSGEQYGVVWIQGGSVRLRRFLPAGTQLGGESSLGANAQNPGPLVQWVGSGWAVVYRSAGNLYFGRFAPDGSVAVAPSQLTTSAAVGNQFDLRWNGAQLGLAWSEARAGDPPGEDVYVTVLSTAGVKAFPDLLAASTAYADGNPRLYWAGSEFRVVHSHGLGTLREQGFTPAGALTTARALARRSGALGASSDGATAGLAFVDRNDVAFQTTACLADLTAPSCPTASASFDGQKVGLAWTAGADAGSGIQSYLVRRDGNLLADTNGTTLAFDDPGFTPLVGHSYLVTAVDGANLESSGCSPVFAPTALADLSIAKSDGVGTATPGTTVTYTIVAANAGPDAASGALVADTPPPTFIAGSWTCTPAGGATCTPGPVVGPIGDTIDLPAGGSATYTLAGLLRPSARGTFANTATITPPTTVADPDAGDRTSTDSDTLTPLANVRVTQTDSADPIGPYGSVTWTATVTNLGPSSSTGLTLTDALPAGAAFATSTPGLPSCAHAGGTLSCDVGGLGVGFSTTVQVTAAANPGFVGTLANTATVSGTESDPVPADNTSTENTRVVFLKGDMNLDAGTDLLFRLNPTGQNDAWLMSGTTRIGAPATLSPTPSTLDWVIAGTDDFSGDYRNDLLLWNTTTGAAEFWLMNGTTRVGAPVALAGALAPPWKPSATADFDHDAKPDLVYRNFATQKIEIWTMNGTTRLGTIIPSPDQAVASNWEIVGAQDWNGDQNTDFLWYNPNSGKIVLWFMDANVVRITGQFTSPANAGDNNWNVLAMGDYGVGPNGLPDTKDIVWRNASSGRIVVWHMDLAGNRTAGLFTTPMEPSPNPTDWTVVGPR